MTPMEASQAPARGKQEGHIRFRELSREHQYQDRRDTGRDGAKESASTITNASAEDGRFPESESKPKDREPQENVRFERTSFQFGERMGN